MSRGNGYAGSVPIVDEPGDRIARQPSVLTFKVPLEGLATHERDHGAWGIVRAGLVAAGNQLLKHLAQHFGIDRNLCVVGSGLHDREVELVKQVAQDRLYRIVWNADASPVEVVLLKESAVEERHVANERVQCLVVPIQVQGLLVVQPRKEQGGQPVVVEVVV